MRRYCILSLLSVLSFSVWVDLAVPARCEVIHGVAGINMAYYDLYSGINWNEAFDFSTQTVATVDKGDLAWGLNIRGNPYLVFRECYANIVAGTLEGLTVAPSPIGGPLRGEIGFDMGPGVYVVQTSDGLYAKFRNLGYVFDNTLFLKIEYYVQTDGTPNFGPTVAVEPTTWGRVKALYR